MPDHTPRRVVILHVACLLLTLTTAMVMGWFNVYFQFFGETATADDHQLAAGGFAAAAVVLALGGLGVGSKPAGPRALAIITAAAATMLAGVSYASSLSAEPGPGLNGWWDAAGGLVAMPWTWVLIFIGVRAIARSVRGTESAEG